MNILFTASECYPFAKVGGLADVVYALSKSLAKLGHNVKVVIPRYYIIDRSTLEHVPGVLIANIGGKDYYAGVFKSHLPNSDVEIYFIDYELFFGRKSIYTDENGKGYVDNGKRFTFFSIASLMLTKIINFKPDIIHANDWHTASQCALIKTRFRDDFKDTRCVLTIHNLQHQGMFDKSLMELLGIGWEHFNSFEFEALGCVNLLKGGIKFADAVTTVSPKYAKEIQTPEFGFGLHEHIRAYAYKLYGILNGVDYEVWNPKIDKYIAKNYDLDDLSGKKECKGNLQGVFGLEIRDDIPIIGFIGRFVKQKGTELIATVIYRLLDLPLQMVFLGSGEKWAEELFSKVNSTHQNLKVFIGYNDELAHKIEAGSDLFLMPSLFEPCGLNQIYSLRYGTLPIVRAVGGLDDTVENFDPYTKSGWGFKFYDATPEALFNTVKWALETWLYDKEAIEVMIKRAMSKTFNWNESAKQYEKVYECAFR